MLQGVHAETLIFSAYQQTRSQLLTQGWSSIGIASELGGRDVKLAGTKPRRFRMHVTNLREVAKTIYGQLELHDAERFTAPLMRVELTFMADGGNTRVRLRGSTARELTPASASQGATSRGLANEYARSLLDQIAKAIERGSAGSQSRVASSGVNPGASAR